MRAAEKAERREGIREADRYYARALELARRRGVRAGARAAARARRHAEHARRPRRPPMSCSPLVAEEAPAAGRPDLRARALIGRPTSRRSRAGGRRARLRRRGAVDRGGGRRPVLQIRALFQSSSIHSGSRAISTPRSPRSARRSTLAEALDDKRCGSKATCGSARCSTTSAISKGGGELMRARPSDGEFGSLRVRGADDISARARQVPPRRARRGRAARLAGSRLARADRREVLPAPEPADARALCAAQCLGLPARRATAARSAPARREIGGWSWSRSTAA